MRATVEERIAEYLRLRGLAERKGWGERWARREYRDLFGQRPQFTPAELAGSPPAEGHLDDRS